MKHKVCFINTSQLWGGGENWQVETMSALQNQFELISIAHPNGKLQNKVKDFAYVLPFKAGKFSFLNPFKLYKLYKILKKTAPNTILLNTSPDFKLFVLPAKKAGIKNILYRRDNGSPLSPHILNKYLLQKGITSFLPCSNFIATAALSKNKDLIPHDKITVIYNSINLNKWDAKKQKLLIEKQKDITYFGCIGRLSKEKGQILLPEIALNLKKKYQKFKILIAGTGELEEELKEKIVQTGTQDFFQFLGFVSHSKDFMETIDCLIIPSLWEGLPTVAIEAMATLRPVISFDVAGNPEIVINGETGITVPGYDTAKFAEAMGEMLNNIKLRMQMGQKGRTLVETQFSQEKVLKELSRFF